MRNDLFGIGEADEPLHILRDEDLGLHDRDHLAHPHVELPTAHLGGRIGDGGSMVTLVGMEALTLAGHREILAGESTRDDVYFLREYRGGSFSVYSHHVHNALHMVDVVGSSAELKEVTPGPHGLMAYIIGEKGGESGPREPCPAPGIRAQPPLRMDVEIQ